MAHIEDIVRGQENVWQNLSNTGPKEEISYTIAYFYRVVIIFTMSAWTN